LRSPIVLRDLKRGQRVAAQALDNAAGALKTSAGWALATGSPVTTWYADAVQR